MLHSHHMVELMSRGSQIRRAFEEGLRLKMIHGEAAVCDLSLGNPVVEPPPRFREVLLEEAGRENSGLHRYMPNAGLLHVREAVARYLSRTHGLSFGAEHVVMTIGSAGALNAVLKSILEPGDEVVLLLPYFPEYLFYVENHGGVVVTVPTASDFDVDPEAVARVLSPRTRAVIINTPNNPTGRVYPLASLRALGDVLRAHEKKAGREVLLLADAPYAHIVFDGRSVPSPFSVHRHTVLVCSHSKDLAVPGERIGYAAVHPQAEGAVDLCRAISFANRILGYINAPALMQRIAARLQGVTVEAAIYERLRDRLHAALTEIGYECVRPEGAFYLFPRSPIDDLEFTRLLARRLVLVVPGSGFGTPGYFRIAYCVEREVIERSLPRFEEAWREVRGA
jgi:aspartate aminotransferase